MGAEMWSVLVYFIDRQKLDRKAYSKDSAGGFQSVEFDVTAALF